MSLLDRGPQQLIVTPTVRTRDALGAPVRTPLPPVTARGAVQPLTAAESNELGLTAVTIYKFIGRTWPGDIHSKIEWGGRLWDQVGEAKVHSTGRGTKHVEVLLQARGVDVP